MTQQGRRDESGRYHLANAEKPLPSVTTLLDDQLEKPGLEAWKAKHDDWKRRRDRAGLVGTLAHRRILNPLAIRELPVEEMPAEFRTDDVVTDVETAEALWQDVRDEIPISEQPHVEETLWKSDPGYAGTADLITDGIVVDLKTSSSIHLSHKLQCSAYASAARARGIDVDRAAIVRLDYREPVAEVTWLNADELETLYDSFCEHTENFHEQTRVGND